MKKVSIVGSIIVITLAAIVAVSSINNLMNFDERMLEDTEFQGVLKDINRVGFAILESCVDSNASRSVLEDCKEEFMPNLVETCKDKYALTTELCNDSRIEEFFVTIDNRIENLRNIVDDALNELDKLQKDTINYCNVMRTAEGLASCGMLLYKIQTVCLDPQVSTLPSCNDPRIAEILGRQPIQTNDIFEYANQGVLELIDTCLARDELSQNCIDTARQILEQCAIDSTIPACSDPRLSEIANYGITEPEVTEPTIENEIKPPNSSSIHATVDCIPSSDPLKFLAKVSVTNQDSVQRDTDVYVSADWYIAVQQITASVDLLSFEPITLAAGEQVILEGMIQRWVDPSQERELECSVYISWIK